MAKRLAKMQMGKNGFTESFFEQLKRIFQEAEIVKITILKSACRDKKQAEKIAEEIVERLGKNFTYRLVGYVLTINKFRRNVRD